MKSRSIKVRKKGIGKLVIKENRKSRIKGKENGEKWEAGNLREERERKEELE